MTSRKLYSDVSRKAKSKSLQKFQTEQEEFWAGSFGDEYVDRNKSASMVAGNVALFAQVLSKTGGIKSAIEFGANIGLNLRALRTLIPDISLHAVEINETAVEKLRLIEGVTAHHGSLLEFRSKQRFDLSFSKGVLIHISPDRLDQAYEALYRSSRRLICIAEYYSRSPVSISYRGHKDRLYKRDFAGDMLDKYRDLRLVEYGFTYHHDLSFVQDDLNWFLLEKT